MVGAGRACLALGRVGARVCDRTEDVPIPIWLFIWAAAAVLVTSFAALTAGWRTTRLEREHWMPAPRAVSRLFINPATEVVCGAAGVALLGLVVWSGLHGTNVAEINFSVTFVFITFWIGGVLVSVLVGDVFRAFNPWHAIARVGAFAISLSVGRRATPPHYFSYFFFGEQDQFSYLISDPLGTRSASQIYLTALSANSIWYVQVATLVAGHVTGLVLGHDKALAVYGSVRRAGLSQRWMLLMMVAFTCLGLYLLSRANG